MFIRVYKTRKLPHNSEQWLFYDNLVINTSQIASIEKLDSFPKLTEETEKKCKKIFDTTDLSIFDITLSTGKNYLIIGPAKAYDNIK